MPKIASIHLATSKWFFNDQLFYHVRCLDALSWKTKFATAHYSLNSKLRGKQVYDHCCNLNSCQILPQNLSVWEQRRRHKDRYHNTHANVYCQNNDTCWSKQANDLYWSSWRQTGGCLQSTLQHWRVAAQYRPKLVTRAKHATSCLTSSLILANSGVYSIAMSAKRIATTTKRHPHALKISAQRKTEQKTPLVSWD